MAPANILNVKTIIILTVLCSVYYQHVSAQGQLSLLNASIIECQSSVEKLQNLLLNSTTTSTTSTTPTSTSTKRTRPTRPKTTTTTPTSTSTKRTRPTRPKTTTTTPTSTSTKRTRPTRPKTTTTTPTSTSTKRTRPTRPKTTTATPTSTSTKRTRPTRPKTTTTTPTSTSTITPTKGTTEETTIGPPFIRINDIKSYLSASKQTTEQNIWGNQVNSVLESMDIILLNITEDPFEVNSSDLDSKNRFLDKLIFLGEKFDILVIGSNQQLLLNSSDATLQFADEALTVVQNASSMTTLTTFKSSTDITAESSTMTSMMTTLTTFKSSTDITAESSTMTSMMTTPTIFQSSTTTTTKRTTTAKSSTTTSKTTTKAPPDSSTTLIIWLVSVLLLCIIICIILVVWKPWRRRSSRSPIVLPPQQQRQVFASEEATGMRNRGFVRDIEEPQIMPITIPRPVTIPMSARNVQSSASYDRYAPQKPEPKMAPLPRSYKTYT